MEITPALLWLLAVALVLGGLAGAVLPALPGVPLVFGGLWLAAWIDDYAKVSVFTLVVVGVLGALAFATDFAATALGAKRVGASGKAIAGAALGTFFGMFLGLPGLILGPFVGAVIGEVMALGSLEQAMRVGVATWLGLLFGTLAKLAISLTMVGVFVAAYFIP
ncbi:MAG TPA: DUF456 domain-containing protein [Steroidobacteraceae bacterium]|nr:DUF456 domain-containing protein [Steroidobacteraceae bacterium]